MSLLPHSFLDSQQFAVTDVMIFFRSGESLTEMHMDVIYHPWNLLGGDSSNNNIRGLDFHCELLAGRKKK